MKIEMYYYIKKRKIRKEERESVYIHEICYTIIYLQKKEGMREKKERKRKGRKKEK